MKTCLSYILRRICAMIEEDTTSKDKKKVPIIKGDIIIPTEEPTAPPECKPPRRENSLSKWDYRTTNKEYMQQYRADGKDVETGNKYVKKFKGE